MFRIPTGARNELKGTSFSGFNGGSMLDFCMVGLLAVKGAGAETLNPRIRCLKAQEIYMIRNSMICLMCM